MSPSHVDNAIPPAYAAAVRDVCYHSVASLILLIWHCFVTLDDEVEYIWTMRNKNPFKWVYLFTRYVVILAHVTHNFLLEQLANGSNPPMRCSMWYIYVLALSQTLATLLELVLASRVFALYNRSRRVALLLLVVIFAEAAGTLRVLWLHTTAYHVTCLLLQLTQNARYQSILGFIVHCTLIGLTWIKYLFALRAGWGRNPLVSLVVRDSSIVYATIIFLVVSAVIMCDLRDERGVAVIFWSTSLMSILGCRMMLSMERFARREISRASPPGQPLFTSEIRIGTLGFGRTLGNQHDSNVAPHLTLRSNGNIS